jgi:hypothetical protein
MADSNIVNSFSLERGNDMKSFRQNQILALAVCAGVLLVVAISLAGSIAGRTGVTDPRVRIETETTAESAAATREQRYQIIQSVMAGEVATTSERLREATALATAASLLLATELANRRAPANAGQLTSALLKQNLLPVGFSPGGQGQPGTITTSHGMLALRYRNVPIGIEVLSLGADRAAGPAILVRVPEEERGSSSGIWMAERLDEVTIPRPFAPAAELIAMGWQADALPSLK